jgi:hypothetical protein
MTSRRNHLGVIILQRLNHDDPARDQPPTGRGGSPLEFIADLIQASHSQKRRLPMLIVLMCTVLMPIIAGLLLIRVHLNGGTPDDSASPYIGL